jgi:hypothetical protein
MKQRRAFLLDEDVLLEGILEQRLFQKRFIPDERIECGFSYEIIHRKDIGKKIFFSYYDIAKHGLSCFDIVTGKKAEEDRIAYGAIKEDELSLEEIQKMISAAPEFCPITGLERCDSYVFDEGVVYLPYPAYDAYTLPEYDPDSMCFTRVKIDMDDNFRRENEIVCELWEIVNHPDIEKIKEFYHISEEQWKEAIKVAKECEEK